MANLIQMPKLSDTMEEGGIAAWHKKVGEKIKEGDLLLEIETDKATMEYESPEAGILLKIVVEAGQKCALNDPIAVVGEQGEDPEEALKGLLKSEKSVQNAVATEREEPKEVAKRHTETQAKNHVVGHDSPSSPSDSRRLKVSPLARKIALERNIDLATLAGSGPAGRIVQKDLENIQINPAVVPTPSAATLSREDQLVPVNMMRSTIAKRLIAAKNQAPHFYLTRSVDMSKVAAWRVDLNSQLKNSGEKISVNDLIVMAVAKALVKHPQVNSSWEESHIRQFANVHVAVAVAMPAGLVTPVIHNTDHLGVREISKRTKQLVGQVKAGEQVDYTSGTFTVSNLGMFGMEEFTAIINPPQAAILAVGAAKDSAVVEGGVVVVKPVMKMTMSCDHRVVDGAVGAEFMQTLCRYLEDPLMMLS